MHKLLALFNAISVSEFADIDSWLDYMHNTRATIFSIVDADTQEVQCDEDPNGRTSEKDILSDQETLRNGQISKTDTQSTRTSKPIKVRINSYSVNYKDSQWSDRSDRDSMQKYSLVVISFR